MDRTEKYDITDALTHVLLPESFPGLARFSREYLGAHGHKPHSNKDFIRVTNAYTTNCEALGAPKEETTSSVLSGILRIV